MHYYQFNIGDYASHTRNLSLLEDLAYRRLLDEYYLHEQPLNACITSVARQIGLHDKTDEVSFVLNRFFVLTDSGWVNIRAENEIETYHRRIDNASKAGKASAKQRTFNGRSTDVQLTIEPENHRTNNQEPVLNTLPKTNTVEAHKKPRATASRLPADWKPSPEDIKFCKTARPDLKPDYVADCFRDYWHSLPGPKACKTNWPATWRNWVRKEKAQPNAPNKAKQNNADKYLESWGKSEEKHEHDITGIAVRVD